MPLYRLIQLNNNNPTYSKRERSTPPPLVRRFIRMVWVSLFVVPGLVPGMGD
jgi:hypothetical protein